MSCLLSVGAAAQTPTAKNVFDGYMQEALRFADQYPREKVYLHFDNTSYYSGDTIWFKAYLTLAETYQPSIISRPIYVELVDQAGHIADRQILKAEQGEAEGQFILPASLLSGYYEVRAYTRWMLAFDTPDYFSRTFPIYQWKDANQQQRVLTTYELNPSMLKRPRPVNEKLSVRFFPEGGQLVQGIPSQVAFKAESNTAGNATINGSIRTEDGEEVGVFHTSHDGMGIFTYTPSAKPATAQVTYQGTNYTFKLPEALPQGYVLSTSQQAGALQVQVACNAATPQDTLAVFITRQGRPALYRLVACNPEKPESFIVPLRKLPQGVLQLSLLNRQGDILAERFVFGHLQSPLQLSLTGIKRIYPPYAKGKCVLQMNDPKGNPLKGKVSVSIRDGLRSDYMEYDNNLLTDLLLTSDLKGYIHQPGYYFTDASPRKQQELDMLLLVHGWRKYDLSREIKSKRFVPSQLPEQQLIIHGQVKSSILKKNLKDIQLSVMLKEGDNITTGETLTDSLGRFGIPMEDIFGEQEAIIQTRKVGKSRNRDAAIFIDRNFSPALRSYAYEECHPTDTISSKWAGQVAAFDSLYMDSLRRANNIQMLDEVEVKARRKRFNDVETMLNVQKLDAYYDVRQEVDRIRDAGKVVQTIPELMDQLSRSFYWDRSNDTYTYRQKPICYIMDNRILSATEVKMMLTEVDGLASILICDGTGGVSNTIIENTKLSNNDGVDINSLDKYTLFYLVPLPYRQLLNKNETAATGTRQTVLQGYCKPIAYYSPAYPDYLPLPPADRRRTLYWNPSVLTDEQGRATIHFCNNQFFTPVQIQVETLTPDGKVGSLTYTSLEK